VEDNSSVSAGNLVIPDLSPDPSGRRRGRGDVASIVLEPNEDLEPLQIFSSGGALDTFSYKAVKRVFDIAFASTALLTMSPLLLLIAVAIKLSSRGPVLFRQERVGRNGQVFGILKFRTMTVRPQGETDTTWTVSEGNRITPLGQLLRRTCLDEFPQFINVLFGHMSVVGPRPERPYFVEQFERKFDGYCCRHEGMVGITGWAQVNGLRGDTCIQTRAAYDVFYLRNWSLGFDIKILMLTIYRAIRDSS
jgi:lipopolysaccharide/colanic/teichoic acid biosynthesis glycosyltransferase